MILYGWWCMLQALRTAWWRATGAIQCLFVGHRRKFGTDPSMTCIRCGSRWRDKS